MARRGAKRKYRWEEWLGSGRTTILRGIDYHCSQSAMVAQVRNEASKRGVHVGIEDHGESVTMEVADEVHDANKTPVAG